MHGKPKQSRGRLENYLFKDADKNQVYVKSKPEPGARTAVTEYRVLRTNGALSLVECRLLTGRTHQIRAQFTHRRLPLVGDRKYGGRDDGCDIALWSYSIGFTNPATGRFMTFKVKPPRAFPWTEFDTAIMPR